MCMCECMCAGKQGLREGAVIKYFDFQGQTLSHKEKRSRKGPILGEAASGLLLQLVDFSAGRARRRVARGWLDPTYASLRRICQTSNARCAGRRHVEAGQTRLLLPHTAITYVLLNSMKKVLGEHVTSQLSPFYTE